MSNTDERLMHTNAACVRDCGADRGNADLAGVSIVMSPFDRTLRGGAARYLRIMQNSGKNRPAATASAKSAGDLVH